MELINKFKPVESTEQLNVGIYRATIKNAGVKKSQFGNEYIEIEVVIVDHIGAQPSKSFIYDYPTQGSEKFPLEKRIEAHNREITKIFDSFGIERGNFNFQDWQGKIGDVSVVPQASKSGYNELVLYKMTDKQIANRVQKANEIKNEPTNQNQNTGFSSFEDIPI